jgi:hypothetical protein
MSIATLKRKTNNGNPRIAPISGQGPLGFALNGTLRNIGVVGPTNLGPGAMRGPRVQNSQTVQGPIYSGVNGRPSSCCTNDPGVIKTSVKNTSGMLASRNINCPAGQSCNKPMNWFQPVDSGYNQHHTQGQYIEQKQGLTSVCHKGLTNKSIPGPCKGSDQAGVFCKYGCKTNYIGTRKVSNSNYTKPPHVAISQSDYLRTSYLKNRCIPVPPENRARLGHFPPFVNNKGCIKVFINKEEAIAGGLYGPPA